VGLRCDDIINETQCSNSLIDTTLEDKCKIYDNMCKLKCSIFLTEQSCRRDDCLWIKENTGKDLIGRCVDQVWLKIHNVVVFICYYC
jgi:hypothetical protein